MSCHQSHLQAAQYVPLGLGKAEQQVALANNKQTLQGISGHQKLSPWLIAERNGSSTHFNRQLPVMQTSISLHLTRLLPTAFLRWFFLGS